MFTKRLNSGVFSLLVIIAVTSTLHLSVSAQTATGKVPLTHEAMWMLKRVGAPVPSPDGKWAVFSLVEPAYDEKDQVSHGLDRCMVGHSACGDNWGLRWNYFMLSRPGYVVLLTNYSGDRIW